MDGCAVPPSHTSYTVTAWGRATARQPKLTCGSATFHEHFVTP